MRNKFDQKLLPEFNRSDFPRGIALFLDIDGTLVEIEDEPRLVKIPENLKRVISLLDECLDGALALVTGRTIRDVDKLFEPLKLPVSGKHGSEHRDKLGRRYKSGYNISLKIAGIIEELDIFTRKNSGIILENKKETIALHYRLNPAIESDVKIFMNNLISNHKNLEILNGKMVAEIRSKYIHKGTAISKFMSKKPFLGKTPFFFGDDISDEDGFATINSMNGVSISINPRLHSKANFRLESVASVIHWLETFIKTERGTT